MVKVITYGTYDYLHYGHIRLLERAKALGDYLIVGVTSDDFDKARGKINVQQSLLERIEAVKATGLADEVIVEEYEGQKIDDIKRYNVDIFTVGTDWAGKFDYLNEFCKVVYLDRTEGVSSSAVRDERVRLSIGLIGERAFLDKFIKESSYVNGVSVIGIYSKSPEALSADQKGLPIVTRDLDHLLDRVDAVYIISNPSVKGKHVRYALERGKHVLCESPISLKETECKELFHLAEAKGCVLMEALKTAYSTAFSRLVLLTKGGAIGKVISVDATCTSLRSNNSGASDRWGGLYTWGPTTLLPVFKVLGTDFERKTVVSHFAEDGDDIDLFSRISFIFPDAVADVKIGIGVKSEGELIISGTKGYIYVPAPWWKTDYFEVRYENQEDNKRYFYKLDGEGIRYEIAAFANSIRIGKPNLYIEKDITCATARIMEDFYRGIDVIRI